MSDKGFFSRWAQRKQQVQEEEVALQQAAQEAAEAEQQAPTAELNQTAEELQQLQSPDDQLPAVDQVEIDTSNHAVTDGENLLSDEDMQDVNSIDGNTNVSAFFSEGVSEKLRKQALKAMFLKPEFNVRDGMDDYDLDYTDVKELSSDVAAGLRNWFKNKDPMDLEGQQEAGAEAAAAAVEGADSVTYDANGSNESVTDEVQETGSQGDASDASQPSDESMTDEPHPEADQNKTDLASGKTTVADSAPEQNPT